MIERCLALMVPNAHLLKELVHVALFDESQWALPHDVPAQEIVASIRHCDMNQPTRTAQCLSVFSSDCQLQPVGLPVGLP